jgi:FHS family L-fucose permease-like MFS transporter
MALPTAAVARTEEPAEGPRKFGDMFRTADGRNHVITFALVSSLFMLWGMCNGMIDVLNKHFQHSLNLTKSQSGFVQFANYIAYFLMALPAGLFAKKFGYKGGVIVGLVLVAAGAFWFIPATKIGTYAAFLTGLFVLASGLTFLETIANPYTTVLGPPALAAARINLAQTMNGVGWMLGPMVLGSFTLSSTAEVNTSNASLYIPYLGIGFLVVVLAVIFAFSKVPDVPAQETSAVAGSARGSRRSLWSRPHFSLGVLAQFLYVAAQIGIFGFFINYLRSDAVPALGEGFAHGLPKSWVFQDKATQLFHFSDFGGGQLLGLVAFGLFLAGRLSGSFVLRTFKPQRTLTLYAAINVGLMALVVAPLGWASIAALFASFLFMSIMFPTIFSLGIHGLGEHTKQGSSFIVMSIVGGALSTIVMGYIADKTNMRVSFLLPLVCFVGVLAYASQWERLERASRT